MNILFSLNNLDTMLETLLSNIGIWGALISCILILVESILPFLPLCVFVTLEFITFGNIIGFFISWLFTCFGCFISFYLCRTYLKKYMDKKMKKSKDKEKYEKITKFVDKCKFSSLTIIIAIPFTPAFLVNVAAGLSNMPFKKYATSIFIGKIFMVYFWGYIGTTLIESLTHPIYLIKILILLIIAFILSKIIGKIFNIE